MLWDDDKTIFGKNFKPWGSFLHPSLTSFFSDPSIWLRHAPQRGAMGLSFPEHKNKNLVGYFGLCSFFWQKTVFRSPVWRSRGDFANNYWGAPTLVSIIPHEVPGINPGLLGEMSSAEQLSRSTASISVNNLLRKFKIYLNWWDISSKFLIVNIFVITKLKLHLVRNVWASWRYICRQN